MAGHRIGETGFPDSGPSANHPHNSPYALLSGINPPLPSFSNQEGSSFDFGELEQAIVLQGLRINNDEAKASLFGGKPAATLEMFPSWPIRFHVTPTAGSSRSGGESSDSQLEPDSPISSAKVASDHQKKHHQQQQQGRGGGLEMAAADSISITRTEQLLQHQCPQQVAKPEKTLRRLAQNREAARKSRLRKKAYVQQLESSRVKLTQLEQDLHRARSQGMFLGVGGACANISPGAALFDLEYARWLEDDHRHMAELRTGLQAQVSEGDLRAMVDACVSHYDEIFQLKGMAAKSDVIHLFTGMWTSPAERCFLWMGGFRPSELIKMLMSQLDPLTEQQLMGIYNLQQSSQQAEEALLQGLEQLQQSVVDTIASGCINDGYKNMNMALTKLLDLEGFMCQADNLRQQTLHQLHRTLTVRQAARCFMVIGEYYGRLRALSSLWASRPREASMSEENSCQTTSDMRMVQPSQAHFPTF